MKCTKAIIPVAGYGTRRLPITKSIEKCMLPLGNRPVVDYIVQDCIQAGITDIYFVVSGEAKQLRDYYSETPTLKDYLHATHKDELISAITPPQSVRFHYIDQSKESRYGTTVPVWLCRAFIEPNEHVLIMMGDDVIYHLDGSSEAKRLMEVAGEAAAMSSVEIPLDSVSRYGVIVRDEQGYFETIQEKPAPEQAKSRLINVSKYCVPADFFLLVEADMAAPHTGEYMVTDVLQSYKDNGGRLAVHVTPGCYLDAGTVSNWVEANNWLLQNHAI